MPSRAAEGFERRGVESGGLEALHDGGGGVGVCDEINVMDAAVRRVVCGSQKQLDFVSSAVDYCVSFLL